MVQYQLHICITHVYTIAIYMCLLPSAHAIFLKCYLLVKDICLVQAYNDVPTDR